MKNNGVKIDLPQQAIDHYNQKADELSLKLESLKPASSPDNISSSSSHLYTQTFEAKDIKNISISTVDGFGTIHSNYFETSDGQMGLSGDSYAECKKMVNKLSNNSGIKEKVSYNFIQDSIFNWFDEKYNGRVEKDLSFLAYLTIKINDVIEEFRMAIPISFLTIKKPFKIGNIEFNFLRENLFDEIEKNIIEHAKDEKELDSINHGMINMRKKYQGKVCAMLTITAEKNKAIEVAKLESEKSLAILIFFSKPAFIPEITNYVGRMGQIIIPGSHIFIFKDVLPEIKSSIDEQSSHYWHIGEQELMRLHEQGIEFFSKMIANEEKTELEELCYTCIKHYTKAISCTNYYDRLVQLITSIEILLLKDRSDVIENNIGRRLSFLSDKSTESQLEVTKLLMKAYDRRGYYLHHGGMRSVIDILKDLQFEIWLAINNTVRLTSNLKTKTEFIEYIDRKNPPE